MRTTYALRNGSEDEIEALAKSVGVLRGGGRS